MSDVNPSSKMMVLSQFLYHPWGLLTSRPRVQILLSLLIAWKVGGGFVKNSKGKRILFLPQFLYDALCKLFFVLNYAINCGVYLQPGYKLWTLNDKLSPKNLPHSAGAATDAQLKALRSKILSGANERFNESHVVQLFDTLPPATCETMIGRSFNGRVLPTKQFLDIADLCLVKPLQMLGFGWGKRYRNKYVGDPLLVNWNKTFYFPLPVWGNVSIDEIEYRGVTQATMNYNHQPWQDYFRVLKDENDELVILGVWTSRYVHIIT
mmetsp:Transcript_10429/g.11852  ORF Transcript_10429/g.11852 Transcript_10429/m.11852 type:complete len:265 (-) Transcript_10429:26-820(-)